MSRPVRLAAPIALAFVLAAAVAPASCKSATEVTLDIRTLAPGLHCPDLKRVTIVVASDANGAEAMVASGFSSAEVTGACDADDRVGTLVVTPNGDTGAVVVAAAITEDADCRASSAYRGCIVARRVFSFTKHAGLLLPITLERSCLDVPCTSTQSCRAGGCESSDTTCADGVCSSAADPVVDDAGKEIAADGAVVQPDGAVGPPPPPLPPPPPPPNDASSDAPFDANPANFGNGCPTGPAGSDLVDCNAMTSECCYMGSYFCAQPCNPSYYAFMCLGRKECPTSSYCCANGPTPGMGENAQCVPDGSEQCSMSGGHYLCTTDADCPPTKPSCSGIYYNVGSGTIHECQ